MTPEQMSSAPKDGTRILVQYWGYLYQGRDWLRTTYPIWSEARWVKKYAPAHWEPWCGEYNTYSTEHILEKDAIAWLPLPN